MSHQVKPSTAFADGRGLDRIHVLRSHGTSDGPSLILPIRVVCVCVGAGGPSLSLSFSSALVFSLTISVCLAHQSQGKAFRDSPWACSLRQAWSWLSKSYPGLNIPKLNSYQGWSEGI